MDLLNGPEQRIAGPQHEVAGDTFMDAFQRVYHALERLEHDQRRRVITAVQALLPPDPNAIGVLQPRDYLRAGGIMSPDEELKSRQYRAQLDAAIQQSGSPDPFTTYTAQQVRR